MATITDEWNVLAHGPLEQLASNLWRVKGSLPGMSLQRVMTIVRRDDGTLVVHSAIACNETTMRQIEALGRPELLIVPNQGHRLDAPAYRRRYPQLRVYTPSGGRERVEEVVAVDGDYDDFPAGDDVWLEMLHGVKEGEGVMFVRSPDGLSVVLNDAVMNMDTKHDVLGWLFTTIMGSAPGPRVSRFAKLMFIDDKPALRADLERYASIPDLVRVIVSHEKVEHGDAAPAALRKAASYL